MSTEGDRLASAEPVRIARKALDAAGDRVWMVGGALRDARLGREILDLDLAVEGDAKRAALAVARAAGGPAFSLSEAFGSWRALDGDRRWVCDVTPLQGADIVEDLAQRDFTVNAMAVPLSGGERLDPHGGARDLEHGVLRAVGEDSLQADPLRPLRLARLAAELEMAPDENTERLARAAARHVPDAAPERIWAELRRLVCSASVLEGLELLERLDVSAAVLPELDAMRGVGQSWFHHLDVHDHTLEVLRQALALEADPESVFGDMAGPLEAVLAEPLGDELTRGQGLRFAALLHDVAKPATRRVLEDGRVAFVGHDSVGDGMVSEIFGRLRAGGRVRDYVATMTRHHLDLGFLVRDRPLSRRAVYRYLSDCSPVEVEVTVLSCADRLATRGRNAEHAVAAHLDLAREMLPHALEWRAQGGAPAAPVRGDELAAALDMPKGPEVGSLLALLREARFAGEVSTPEEAVTLARRLRHNPVP